MSSTGMFLSTKRRWRDERLGSSRERDWGCLIEVCVCVSVTELLKVWLMHFVSQTQKRRAPKGPRGKAEAREED